MITTKTRSPFFQYSFKLCTKTRITFFSREHRNAGIYIYFFYYFHVKADKGIKFVEIVSPVLFSKSDSPQVNTERNYNWIPFNLSGSIYFFDYVVFLLINIPSNDDLKKIVYTLPNKLTHLICISNKLEPFGAILKKFFEGVHLILPPTLYREFQKSIPILEMGDSWCNLN